jgi:membrane-associated protease RseP (regulator of RpoE activity)
VKDPLEDVQLTENRKQSFAMLAVILGLLLVLFVASPWVAAMILGIIALVMFHEAGHYLAARRAGMKATEFFLGFGPRLWSFTRGETEYGVKAIPAGGYVRIIGMSNLEDVAPEDEARTFRRGTTTNRLIVILAGVTVNILLAWLLMTVAIAGRGGVYENHPSLTVGLIEAGTAASKPDANGRTLQVGDRVVAVGDTRLRSWTQLRGFIQDSGGAPIELHVIRDGRPLVIAPTPRPDEKTGEGFLGVAPDSVFRPVSVIGAAPEGLREMGVIVTGTGRVFGHLFTPAGVHEYSKNFSGNAPKAGSKADQERPRSLVGIVDEGSSIVAGNVWALLSLLGAISLALALFNLIPLLPFDGGHAAVVIYEAIASRIKGRTVRVDFRKLMPVTAVVLALFLMLGLSAMALDIRDIAR